MGSLETRIDQFRSHSSQGTEEETVSKKNSEDYSNFDQKLIEGLRKADQKGLEKFFSNFRQEIEKGFNGNQKLQTVVIEEMGWALSHPVFLDHIKTSNDLSRYGRYVFQLFQDSIAQDKESLMNPTVPDDEHNKYQDFVLKNFRRNFENGLYLTTKNFDEDLSSVVDISRYGGAGILSIINSEFGGVYCQFLRSSQDLARLRDFIKTLTEQGEKPARFLSQTLSVCRPGGQGSVEIGGIFGQTKEEDLNHSSRWNRVEGAKTFEEWSNLMATSEKFSDVLDVIEAAFIYGNDQWKFIKEINEMEFQERKNFFELSKTCADRGIPPQFLRKDPSLSKRLDPSREGLTIFLDQKDYAEFIDYIFEIRRKKEFERRHNDGKEHLDLLIPCFKHVFRSGSVVDRQQEVQKSVQDGTTQTSLEGTEPEVQDITRRITEEFSYTIDNLYRKNDFSTLKRLKNLVPGSSKFFTDFESRLIGELIEPDEQQLLDCMSVLVDTDAQQALPDLFQKIYQQTDQQAAHNPLIAEALILRLNQLLGQSQVSDLAKKAVQNPRGAQVFLKALEQKQEDDSDQDDVLWKKAPWVPFVKTEAETTLKRYEERKKLGDTYQNLVSTYHAYFQRVKNLSARLYDEQVETQVRNLEALRHEIHLQLLELGKKLKKDRHAVLVDIIREQKTLEEYDLPEFSILKEDDILDTGDWHDPYRFNVDTRSHLPSNYRNHDKTWQRATSVIPEDKCMIVFNIAAVSNYGLDSDRPIDFFIRRKRAEALAQSIKGEVFNRYDSGYHTASASILGVMIEKKDLERVAGIIRDNPKKFRLGDQFYSATEQEEVAEIRKKMEEERKFEEAYDEGLNSENADGHDENF